LEHIELHRPSSLGQFVANLLDVFSKDSPHFLKTVSELDDRAFMGSKHKTRRYVAESKELLYIGNPKLADKFARQQSGLWFVTNISAKDTSRIAHMVARAARVPCESLSTLTL
jgi:hypothetical protein